MINQKESPTVLIVEDERPLSLAIAATVQSCGGTPIRASTLAQAQEALNESPPAAIILDIGLPDGNGLGLLPELATPTPVIVVTAHGEIENAIEARKQGVHEFFDKPIEFERFRNCLTELLSERREPLQDDPPPEGSTFSYIGAAPAMRPVFQRIAQACASSDPVLITGGTGTGKTTVARLIAREDSARSDAVIDLLQFTENESSEALAGKLLIADPITQLGINEQAQLIQALADPRNTPGRIIATASSDIRDQVESGAFLSELYYRLQVLEIRLPPLSERRDDIPALANFFLGRLSREFVQFAPTALAALMEHDWPGNLRELRNSVVYANTLRGGRPTIESDLLPDYFISARQTSQTDRSKESFERALDNWIGETSQLPEYKTLVGRLEKILIDRLLDRFDGKLAPMARALNANRTTLRKRVEADL